MKKLLSLIVLFVLINQSYGNVVTAYTALYNKVTVKNRFVLEEEVGLQKVLVPFVYNKAITHFNPSILLKLSNKSIRKIEYVVTENTNKVYQEKLNIQRLDTLFSMYRHRLDKLFFSIDKEVIIQTQKEDMKKLFNGFVVTLEVSSRKNSKFVTSFIEKGEEKKKSDRCTFNLDTLPKYGYVIPHVEKSVALNEYRVTESVLARNKQWKNKLVVLDVTGSMTPYISQYLLWLKLNYNVSERQHFVFFNDGNDALRGKQKKQIGSTGGIYCVNGNMGFEMICSTIVKAMSNGGGGDVPENNIEAIIEGERKYRTVDDIILIADNNATPRDLDLAKQIKKPVHVILCGANNGYVNESYLNLAFATKGSVHTIEEDLKHLMERKEGEHFMFMHKEYKIQDGKVVLVLMDKT